MKQFCRTEMLIGAEAQQKLNNASVAVFGLGGVGSYTVEALARAGVGNLTLVDFDKVDETNINRQLFALHSTVGMLKTDVAKARVADINPQAQVTAVCCRFDQNTATTFDFAQFNYVVDAIDTVSSKLLLAQICFEQNVPLVSCMGTGNKYDASAFRVADVFQTSMCPLAKVMRKELKARGVTRLKVVYSEEQPQTPKTQYMLQKTSEPPQEPPQNGTHVKATPSSISYVPPVAGMILAGEVIKGIIGN